MLTFQSLLHASSSINIRLYIPWLIYLVLVYNLAWVLKDASLVRICWWLTSPNIIINSQHPSVTLIGLLTLPQPSSLGESQIQVQRQEVVSKATNTPMPWFPFASVHSSKLQRRTLT